MELANGAVLSGRYKIVKFLGQGGFGCTYLAQHAFLDAKFAIKEFFPADFCLRGADGSVRVATEARSADFDKLRQKFVREARALEHFKNTKGIVSVVDVFEENGTAYFVMDYIEGMSVEKMLQLDGSMEEGLAVRIIRETALALAEVHKRNYLHLDIKPDNIMLDFDYHPVLIDFGVSKLYDAGDGHNSSTLIGCTPAFAPLEQINADVRRFYPATDIYSLGATLYAMLTGQNPDKASDRINFPHALSDDLPAGTSPAVAAAIEAAMRIPIAERPQSVAEFLAILDGAGGGAQPPKPPVATKPMPKPQPQSAPPAPPVPPKKTSPLEKALNWTIASIAVLVIGAIIFAILGDKDPADPMLEACDTVAAIEEPVFVDDCDTAAAIEEPKEGVIDQAKAVVAPPSTNINEVVMICAKVRASGEFRKYTVKHWSGMNGQEHALLEPVGVLVNTVNHKFVVALEDAGGGREFEWGGYEKDVDGLTNVQSEANAKNDFNGLANTNKILDFGRANGIKFPAAEAAKNYSKGGLNWYLPAAGQLWLIFQYRDSIDRALSLIGGKKLSYFWSSTQYSNDYAWYVYVFNEGTIYFIFKYSGNCVRPVAQFGPVVEEPVKTANSINGHEYVDLGLSVKWATCNVGASLPKDYGSYFAWGETTTKSQYKEENSLTFGKSGFGNIGGNPQYDAATANWSAPWRLPTKSELDELCNSCKWNFTSNGIQVTGPNGNSIFLPAAGSYYYGAGSSGCYWTSTTNESSELAYCLDFACTGPKVFWLKRDQGFSVRPVTE